MYNERISPKREKSSSSNYCINPIGVLIFLAKIFYYGVLLCAPFICWYVLNLDHMIGQYKAFFLIGLYILMAQEFIRNPSRFILRGTTWNETVIIQRTIYKHADNGGDLDRIHHND
jgi:hypothetical protein